MPEIKIKIQVVHKQKRNGEIKGFLKWFERKIGTELIPLQTRLP